MRAGGACGPALYIVKLLDTLTDCGGERGWCRKGCGVGARIAQRLSSTGIVGLRCGSSGSGTQHWTVNRVSFATRVVNRYQIPSQKTSFPNTAATLGGFFGVSPFPGITRYRAFNKPSVPRINTRQTANEEPLDEWHAHATLQNKTRTHPGVSCSLFLPYPDVAQSYHCPTQKTRVFNLLRRRRPSYSGCR